MSAPDIRVLLLDADGVFQRTPPATWSAMYAAVPHPDKEAFRAAVMAVEESCIASGTPFEKALAPTLRAWHYPGEVAAFLAHWHTIELDFGVLGVVAELRAAGIHCCVASNQLAGRAEHMSEVLGVRSYFDREFYGYALGAWKPEPVFFQRALRLLAVPAPQVLFVDDRAQNVAAAREVGLRAALFPEFAGGAALRHILVTHGLAVATD